MLKKLLKYDLKDRFKVLLIFYSLSLVFAVLTRVFLNIENSLIINIIGKVCSGVTISMVFNILINNLMRLWVRFKQNLYGDESYLTHTLPVDKTTLYFAEILVSIITLFTSIAVIILSFFIAYYSKENIELIKNILLPVAAIYGSTITKILLALFFIFFLEFLNILQSGFTGIILGHKMNNAKTGYSVIFGFAVYTITQIFVLIVIFLAALFNKDLMNIFITSDIVNVDILKMVIYLSIIVYTVTFVIGYIVNLKLFKKGVNID